MHACPLVLRRPLYQQYPVPSTKHPSFSDKSSSPASSSKDKPDVHTAKAIADKGRPKATSVMDKHTH